MKNPTLLITILTTFATSAIAQVYTPPPGSGKDGPSNRGNSNNNRNNNEVIRNQNNNQNNNQSGSAFGNELPFLNPSNELVSWNGSTWAATDNRLLAARFERYLNEPADNSEAAQEYRDTIAQILELISPHHTGGPDFPGAVKLLPKCSSYPGDAKLCDSLSQAIYAAVLAQKDVGKTRVLNEAMESEKKRLIAEADWQASTERDPSLNQRRPANADGRATGEGNGPAEDEGRGAQSLRYKEHLRRIAEIETLKKTNTAKNEVQLVQAKIQYQALMVQFFVQRRFQHVMMASRFYHQIFQDGDNRLRLKKDSDVSQMISDTFGTSPTVAALDSLASEAVRDVDKGVEAFLFLIERDELESAAKRLSESYMVGEFMPSIQTLPREKKRVVLDFVRKQYRLIAAIDSKDYTTAETLIEELQPMAKDFDATKAQAAIATYTRVSDMHINSAKLAASQGNNEKAAVEIGKAMEVWPQNPKLKEFDQLVEQGSQLAMVRNDFDRLLSENNYREIFRRQYEIAPAIKDDPQKQDAFQQIITNIFRIDGALEKASEFKKMGQPYAAYEQLATLREEFPDDPKLGRELERLAPQVADFTKALDEARGMEQRRDQQLGSAMSWYLKARSIHPGSEIAQTAIDRLARQFLNQNSAGKSATANNFDDGYVD